MATKKKSLDSGLRVSPPAPRCRGRDGELTRKMRTAEQRGRTAERDRLMPALLESSARLALREAGFSGNKAQLDRMLRSIDPRDPEGDIDADEIASVGMDEEGG